MGIVGLGYCVLEFIPSIEPPANMRYVHHPRVFFYKCLVLILITATVMRTPAGVLSKSNHPTDNPRTAADDSSRESV